MTAAFAVKLTRAAVKEIARLTPKVRGQIAGRLDELETNPRPHDARRLVGKEKCYRLDVGEYRLLYDVDDAARLVTVWRAKHRKDAYRNL